MHRLFILYFLLFTSYSTCAQILFTPDPSPPTETKIQQDINSQTNVPNKNSSQTYETVQSDTNIQHSLENQQTNTTRFNSTPESINFDRIKSSRAPQLEAAWHLAKIDTLWAAIKRRIINDDTRNDPKEPLLSKEEAVSVMKKNGVEIDEHNKKIIEESEYKSIELERYIHHQKNINTLKSIMGKLGPLEFLVEGIALATDPISLTLFLSIVFFAKRYKTCLILALFYSSLLSLIMINGSFPWHSLDHFDGLMWWLMMSLGGVLVTLLAFTTKKILKRTLKAEENNHPEKIKLLTFVEKTPKPE